MPGWGFCVEPWAVVLGRELADVFAVEGWQVLNGTIRFRGRLLVDPELAMHLVTQRVEPLGFVPMLHTPGEIALLRLSTAARREPQGWRGWPLNLALFLATLCTTLFVGAIIGGGSAQPAARPGYGVPFSASLLLILGCHELTTSRRGPTASRSACRISSRSPFHLSGPWGRSSGCGPRFPTGRCSSTSASPARCRDSSSGCRSSLGFYITGHPLARYEEEIRLFGDVTAAAAHERVDQQVRMVGLVAALKKTQVKKGRDEGKVMAKATLEDLTGSVPVTIFASLLARVGGWLGAGHPVRVTGTVRPVFAPGAPAPDEGEGGTFPVEIIAREIEPLEGLREQTAREVYLVAAIPETLVETFAGVKELLETSPGATLVRQDVAAKRD